LQRRPVEKNFVCALPREGETDKKFVIARTRSPPKASANIGNRGKFLAQCEGQRKFLYD
jgi:hypothetical protein